MSGASSPLADTGSADDRESEVVLVMTNAPDGACAERIADAAVAARLAACANILAPCRSVYRWQGTVERAEEVPVLLKTTRGSCPRLQSLIRELHPYEVPEIITLGPVGGLPAYLAWVAGETGDAP